MSTHNMFSLRSKKNIDTFWWKKAPYQQLQSYFAGTSQRVRNCMFGLYCLKLALKKHR